MEKVISEWRVVETDDGFRIEVKGDKEAMRGWFEHLRTWGPMRMGGHMRPFAPWSFCGPRGFWHHGHEDEQAGPKQKD